MSRWPSRRGVGKPWILGLVLPCVGAVGCIPAQQGSTTKVLVNQRGYLPPLEKVAVLKSDKTSPLSWRLHDGSGKVVSEGTTTVRGLDKSSGEPVHQVDFSRLDRPASGLTLEVEGDTSHPFDIGWDVYKKLKYDALAYFYHNRSGAPIRLPYAGDAKWERPAGHPGDTSVPCAPDAQCSYSLDVSGGWYDAGDHGKYVVNGGISVWTLLNQYERLKAFGAAPDEFADGKMAIPEAGNGVPDLLDEVRWELEFLLKMQVPEGKPRAGMAHHKMHGRSWSPLGTAPDRDPIARHLRPVSTAATLNLAAVAAQGARIWKTIDPTFSDKCLVAAERAFAAAIANPAVYAPKDDHVGGGPYEDTQVIDEFYWGAAELFITTGKDTYRDYLTKSPHYLSVLDGSAKDTPISAMTWQSTAALGTISLALVPSKLPEADVQTARKAIVKAGEAFLAIALADGYHVPLRPEGKDFTLPWGSNSNVANNALVLGLAFDITKEQKYLSGVQDAMSYLLGRNPLDQTYITGYGANPLLHPHHRFWARQANSAFPPPPPGALSGGPNSGLQDPFVKSAELSGCAPMKCFADNIEAYSTNEVAINWNAPLAWVTAFLDDQAIRMQKP